MQTRDLPQHPTQADPSVPVERGAVFAAEGRYRYRLTRRWAPGGEQVAFVLLNPSTADAQRDDPTLRRCMGFARAWGFAALEVVNLFAYRTPHPARLRRVRAPVGPENDAYLLSAVQRSVRTVLAWGNHGTLAGRDRAVLELLGGERCALYCLGTTLGGHPRHVLYLPAATRPVRYRGPTARPARAG